MIGAPNKRPRAARNYPLLLGLLLTLGLALLAALGPLLAPHDPLERAGVVFAWGAGTQRPPFRPLQVAGYPLGTDEVGRDLLSRLLWAVRPSMLLCALVVAARFVLGLPLGLLSGWYGGIWQRIVAGLGSVCLALPVLVFAVATILLLGIERGLWPFVVGLTLTGWVNIAAFVQQRTRQLRSAAFIESARALGIGTPRLLCVHIAPHIMAAMPLLLCFELAAALLLLAELGYLGVFIGGGYVYSTAEGATRVTSSYPELGQLLSSFWATLYRAPWVSLFAGGLLALAISGCSLLGEGLRRRLDVTRPRRRWRRR